MFGHTAQHYWWPWKFCENYEKCWWWLTTFEKHWWRKVNIGWWMTLKCQECLFLFSSSFPLSLSSCTCVSLHLHLSERMIELFLVFSAVSFLRPSLMNLWSILSVWMCVYIFFRENESEIDLPHLCLQWFLW